MEGSGLTTDTERMNFLERTKKSLRVKSRIRRVIDKHGPHDDSRTIYVWKYHDVAGEHDTARDAIDAAIERANKCEK